MNNSLFPLSVLTLLLAACSGAVHPQASSVAGAPSCSGGTIHGDAELGRLEHCISVEGDLRVTEVTSLKPLAALERVNGTLAIGPTRELSTLDGLENLASVRTLELTQNRGLINPSALNDLTQAERVTVEMNPRLSKSFGFFDKLPLRDAKLELSHNAGLEAEGLKPVVTSSRASTIAYR
jgi:hypothetical protein